MVAILKNDDHPEYGEVSMPLPIKASEYGHCMELLSSLGIGDALNKDCQVEELTRAYPTLRCLEGSKVNIDELDYLAKRLDGFDAVEVSQFQAMADKLKLTDMKDLINLTFSCQQATVIADFSDLESVGRAHYMNTHDGCASAEELDNLDGEETAILLIEDNEGTITRYGVVYDNGMQLSQLYDGKNLPCYHEELAPTLKGSAGGNCMPSVLCLNDQGGSVMEVTEDRTGTLRAQEHGHQPLVYENHGIDARYTGPHTVAPTMSARYGTGGNNVPLVEQESVFCITGNAIDRKPENGGNGIGYQEDISYTLTATDHHAVFSRQRVDVFKDGKVVSTQSARQHKDATDLVLEEAGGPKLIRRLTPLECERLQGFPDGWTGACCASDSARYKALGNSVAIPCVEFILQAVLAVVEGDSYD